MKKISVGFRHDFAKRGDGSGGGGGEIVKEKRINWLLEEAGNGDFSWEYA